MENNETTADDSLDSVPQPLYEALEAEEPKEDNIHKRNSSLTMDTEDILNSSFLEDEEDEEDDDDEEENDMELEIKNYSKHPTSLQNPKKNNTLSKDPNDTKDEDVEDDEEEEEYSHDFDVEAQLLEDNPQSFIDNLTPEKHDPLIIPENDVRVKKIKICTNKNFNLSKTDKLKQETSLKTKKLQTSTIADINKTLQPQQLRSSTPMSREYLALQRSVNESKILTKFVSETANEKPRKLRIKDSANTSTSSNTDHSYSSLRKSNNSNTQLSPEKTEQQEDATNSISPSSQGKRQQHNKRYAPLKYGDSDVDGSSVVRPRSRSKSMHNSEFALSGSQKKLKKWPSEERLNKRTNMRSENSEFVQKQLDFLQRVIHSCETPRSRSRSRSKSGDRSRSAGRKTPLSVVESVGGGGLGGVVIEGNVTDVGNQQKPQKLVAYKERSSKRSKHEATEHDEQQLSQVSLGEPIEPPDDVSVNESNTSMMGVSAIVDSSMADVDNLDAELQALWQPPPKPGSDSFCWKCHETSVNLCCSKCIRSFHAACAKMYKLDSSWICPECATVDNMLNNHKRSRRHELSLDLLSQLLSFALKRMRYAKGHYNFVMPYEEKPIDNKFILNPLTLTKLQIKIEMKHYRCAEELVNETKWLLHNAYILSGGSSTKTVMAAKAIFKICRQEANEIETCPECYLNANTRTDWFVDVCSQPHLLLWAKLKGFPYWPAKAMGLGQNSLVNVRFFGEHDRAFVPMKDCFLYSEQDPNTATGKRAAKELADCIKEVQEHIEKIRAKVGAFKYAAFKTPYDLTDEMKQLEDMMPGVQEYIKKHHILNIKPSLQFKIYKTADNNLSIVHKASTTPELQLPTTTAATTTSTHDNEDKKKKSSFSEVDDCCKKLEDFHASTPKYEVISKVSSDDSNSSKLGTVILKRKSVNGDSKKSAEDDAVELPLPKMTKIEDHLLEVAANNANLKRKSEIHSSDKTKTKHGKVEPKLPVLTIKTTNAKEALVIKTNEVNKTTLEGATKENAGLKQSKPQHQATQGNDSLATQKVVENLVKNKQGVTIKKISKEVPQTNSPDKTNNAKDSETSPIKSLGSPTDKVAKQKAEEEKARENQKVNNILKGLVPFVEVKKEVLSDNEQENDQNEKATDTTKRSNDLGQTSTQNNNISKEANLNNNPHEINTRDKEEELMPLLSQVKEEIISDDEDLLNPTLNTNTQNTQTTFGTTVEKPNINNVSPAAEVRMVGDTTIQKLSCKNQQNQYALAAPSTSSAASNNNNSNNNNISSKRATLKGVPYGPLPASAFPKSIPSKTFLQNEMAIQPRAKKTFPQHSPPLEKLRSATTNQNTPAQIISNSTSTTNSHLDPKKSMAKTTMVAIPVDVASNRASTSVGSIPVPPLTAVSKTLPHSPMSFNSMARNSPNTTTTTSGSLSGLSTASVMNETKTSASLTLTTAATHSPLTVVASSSSSSSALSMPLSTQQVNAKNPLTMSTPPPLAGLSGSIISSTQQNGLIDSNAATTTPSLAAISSTGTSPSSSSTDTHLLGGLVTPSLASAITDVICRGPPKLSVRPSGPLQSEGHPLFPSQAGPVCKRLVENVHKLTDFFISVVEDTMGEMAQGDEPSLQAKITLLTMELERSKQSYEQEIAELKRTSDLMLCEMSKSMDIEKTRLAIDIRKQCELERIRSVEETKRKQWCANCFREANFYCCWNTSYCDYPCQQLHWPRHAHSCAQTRPCGNDLTKAGATTTTGSLHNLNQQQERHHATKSNSSSANISANFNKSTATTTISHKKEKGGVSKNSSNHMMTSSTMPSALTTSTARTNTEVLKLPTNTYLRPVTSTVNNQTLRCNTTYSIPVQRFNVPLPITTPANTISPQTFTIVQQGNSWVMSSGGNINSNSSSNNNNMASNSTTSSATIAAPIVSVPQVVGQQQQQQQQQQRTAGGAIMTNKSSKAQIRYH